MSKRFAIVGGEHAGMRLDTFLARHLTEYLSQCGGGQGRQVGGSPGQGRAQPPESETVPGTTRSAFQRLIASGQVTVNGQRAKAAERLKVDDRIEVQWPPPRDAALLPEPIPLHILYEDGDLVVVNKPPGMVVHPAAGNHRGTLVNALLYHCPDLQGIGGERRPGIVHRLDKGTSGAMVVAKNEQAFHQLAWQFKERKVTKEYSAFVWGRMERRRGIIDRPIGRHRRERKWMSSLYSLSHSRGAVTHWEVKESFCFQTPQRLSFWITLLCLRPQTGRTHQIRVHLADQGYPVVGDRVYGRKGRRTVPPGVALVPGLVDFPRQALHADRLGFIHPRTQTALEVLAPWFSDMSELLEAFKGHRVCGAAAVTDGS